MRTLYVPFSVAFQVTVVPAVVGFGETETMVTVGVVASTVTASVSVRLPVGVVEQSAPAVSVL